MLLKSCGTAWTRVPYKLTVCYKVKAVNSLVASSPSARFLCLTAGGPQLIPSYRTTEHTAQQRGRVETANLGRWNLMWRARSSSLDDAEAAFFFWRVNWYKSIRAFYWTNVVVAASMNSFDCILSLSLFHSEDPLSAIHTLKVWKKKRKRVSDWLKSQLQPAGAALSVNFNTHRLTSPLLANIKRNSPEGWRHDFNMITAGPTVDLQNVPCWFTSPLLVNT